MTFDFQNWTRTIASWKIEPAKKQLDQLDTFLCLLLEKNRVMNLTAITSFPEICTLHLTDSLALCHIRPSGWGSPLLSDQKCRVMDIGSGAGFPGMILKIFCPKAEVTLLDALEKRVLFLREAAAACGITEGLSVIHGRAEDVARDITHRASYDVVTARAVARCGVLAEYALPFVKTGGWFAAYKSDNVSAEVADSKNACNLLGGTDAEAVSYELPGSDMKRQLVFVQKTGETPDKYPRRAGMPEKKPL